MDLFFFKFESLCFDLCQVQEIIDDLQEILAAVFDRANAFDCAGIRESSK